MNRPFNTDLAELAGVPLSSVHFNQFTSEWYVTPKASEVARLEPLFREKFGDRVTLDDDSKGRPSIVIDVYGLAHE